MFKGFNGSTIINGYTNARDYPKFPSKSGSKLPLVIISFNIFSAKLEAITKFRENITVKILLEIVLEKACSCCNVVALLLQNSWKSSTVALQFNVLILSSVLAKFKIIAECRLN